MTYSKIVGVLSCLSIIAQSRVSYTKFIKLVGYTKYCGTATFWSNYFLNELLFQSLYFL